MRLTLRTLLAYMDDILPPAETKELGEKIAAAPAASQLVDRIRDVMRRRRLTAPEPDGSGGGIEPNLVSEYLDNSLPPERVADVERVCLESDVNLAEAAACHQILTLVLGEPVEIGGRLRERMYALGPQGTPLDVPEPVSPSKRVGETTAREQLAAIQAAQKAKPAPAPKPLESRLPDYLRQKPLWKRALPWAAVAAALAVWLGVLATDSTFFGGRDADDAEGGRVADDADAAPADRERAERRPEPAGPDSDTAVVAAVAPDELPDLPVDPAPPADDVRVIENDATPADGDAPEPAGDTAVAAAATAVPATGAAAEGPEPAGTPTAAAETVPADTEAPAVDVVSTTGVVLTFDEEAGQWFPLPIDEDPAVGVPIAVPEPFETQFSVAGSPLRIIALGGTRLVPLGRTEAGPVGFDIAQGRLRVSGDTAAVNDAAEMMFALRLGQGLWRVEPLTPDTTLGVEALPLQPTSVGQDLAGRTPQGVVYVGTGAVRVADAAGRIEVASAGNRLILTPDGQGGIGVPMASSADAAVADAAATTDAGDPEPAAEPQDEGIAPGEAVAGEGPAPDEPATETAAPSEPTPVGTPDWLTPRGPTSAARRVTVTFAKEFVPGAPAGQSLLPAVDSPIFWIAEPAAKALGLIEDVGGMVKALRDAEHPEAVLAAIDGLRNWLGRSAANGERLREELDLVFAREGLSETLDRLLWGYGREDARDEATSRQLVEWLSHPEPIVRELAFYHVRRLSGRTMNYRPYQSIADRAGAVNRWRDFVDRNGGLVVSE